MADINLFGLRTMLRVLEQLKPARKFLLNTFFSAAETHITESVDIDIVKGKRRMAPFVNPRLEGRIVDRLGYKTFSYKPPYIKPKMVTTAEDLLIRQPGEIIYGSDVAPGQRAQDQLVKDLAELDDIITRREEWMAAQALFTGKIHVVGDGVDDIIDFLMESSHKPVLTGTALWSAPTTADPLANLRTWKRIVSKDSGLSCNIGLMSTDTYDAFLNCLVKQSNTAAISMVQVSLGKIEPTQLPDGVTYIGRINELGMDLYTYEEWYLSDLATSKDQIELPMVPSGKVLLGSTQARTTVHYGAIKDLKALAAMARFPKSWEEDDPSVRMLMVQSAPLPTPHQIDAFLVGTVL